MDKLRYNDVKEFFLEMKEKHDIEEMENKLLMMCDANPIESVKYKKAFFATIKDWDLATAVKYGEEIIKVDNDPKFMKVLAVRYKRLGQISKYNSLVNKKIPLIEFKNQLAEYVQSNTNYETIQDFINQTLENNPILQLDINKISFSLLKDKYTSEAIKFAEIVISQIKDPKFIKVVANRYKKLQDFKRSEELLNLIKD
jgi:DICT domain-containing protein